jgi:hypothetical protein
MSSVPALSLQPPSARAHARGARVRCQLLPLARPRSAPQMVGEITACDKGIDRAAELNPHRRRSPALRGSRRSALETALVSAAERVDRQALLSAAALLELAARGESAARRRSDSRPRGAAESPLVIQRRSASPERGRGARLQGAARSVDRRALRCAGGPWGSCAGTGAASPRRCPCVDSRGPSRPCAGPAPTGQRQRSRAAVSV